MRHTSFSTLNPLRFLTHWLLPTSAFLLCQLLIAQYNLASLGGVVVDPTGGAVPNAKVSIRNTGTGLTRTVTAGENGAFVLLALPVGAYNLTVEKTGFSTHVREGILLTVDQAGKCECDLAVGAGIGVGHGCGWR